MADYQGKLMDFDEGGRLYSLFLGVTTQRVVKVYVFETF